VEQYKCKETGKIEDINHINKQHKEIIHNSSYGQEEIKDIINFRDFLEKCFIKVE